MRSISAPTLIDKIGVILLGSILAIGFISMRYLAEFISPLETDFWREFITVVLLGIGIKVSGIKYTVSPADKKYFMAYGIVGLVLLFVLLTKASQVVSGGKMSLLTSISPFVAIVFNHFLAKDDKMTIPKILGAIVGFWGVCIVLWESATMGVPNVWGNVLVIVALIMYVISSDTMRRCSHIHGLVFVYCSLMWGSIYLLVSTYVLGDGLYFEAYDTNIIIVLSVLGIFPTAIGLADCFALINKVGYSFVSLTGHIIPIADLIMGNIFLGESISPSILTAVGLILLGLWISAYKKK